MRVLRVSEPVPRTSKGTFAPGNQAASLVRLLDLPTEQAEPWVRPYLARAQQRFSAAKRSGLFRAASTRLDGLLRASLIADCMSEALAAHGMTLPPSEAKAWFAESRAAARDSRAALLKLVAWVGIRKGENARGADPLAALAAELSGDEHND